jgi:AraC family transcriptional regulator
MILPKAYGVVDYPPGAVFGPRKMMDFEFVWMLEGDALYSWGNEVADAPPDSIVLCRPGHTDTFRWDPKHRTRHAFFHFDLPPSIQGLPPVDQWPLVRVLEEGDILRPLFRYVLTWARSDQAGLIENTILHMVRAFVVGQVQTESPPGEPLPDAIERALEYVRKRLDANPSAPIAFEELVDASLVTGPHLCRLFKRHTGYTPSQTVRLARLDRAASLLARSNYSVKEISCLCGFATPFHFSRAFKEAYGASPQHLRERIQGGETPPPPRLVREFQRTS